MAGGGRKDRLKDKSIDLGFTSFFKKYNVKILSLQYGDDKEIVKNAATNSKLILLMMRIFKRQKIWTWLDQVEACDGIVSIANTTIHGAGSLNKPTLCLLGAKSDWRWLCDKEEKFSYWYPSVEIAWQDEENQDWGPALARLDLWMQERYSS